MREDNGDQSHRVFDMPPNDLDFDDFHPYPLTFRDALATDELSHPSQVFTSVVPMSLDSRQEEVNPRDKDDDSERGETDPGNVSAESADFKDLSTSGREAGGSEVRGAAGSGTGSWFSANNGVGSHEFNDDQSEGVSSDDADSDDVDSNDMESGVSQAADTNHRNVPSDAEHIDPPAWET